MFQDIQAHQQDRQIFHNAGSRHRSYQPAIPSHRISSNLLENLRSGHPQYGVLLQVHVKKSAAKFISLRAVVLSSFARLSPDNAISIAPPWNTLEGRRTFKLADIRSAPVKNVWSNTSSPARIFTGSSPEFIPFLIMDTWSWFRKYVLIIRPTRVGLTPCPDTFKYPLHHPPPHQKPSKTPYKNQQSRTP